MSRTLAGNLTGRAAHGHDDTMDEPSDYYLDIAKLSIRVKEIFGDPMTYVHWMMKIPEGKMLEYMKEIVRQVDEVAADTEWLSGGIAHYTEAEPRKAQADAICEAYETRYMNKTIALDVSDKFNCGAKVTASKTWVERHL